MAILISFFFSFSKNIGFYKVSFLFFYFSSFPRIPTPIPCIPIQILCIPTQIPRIPISVPRILLIPFPNSPFQFLQIAYVTLQIFRSRNTSNEIISIIRLYTINSTPWNYYSSLIFLPTDERLMIETYENKFIRSETKYFKGTKFPGN